MMLLVIYVTQQRAPTCFVITTILASRSEYGRTCLCYALRNTKMYEQYGESFHNFLFFNTNM